MKSNDLHNFSGKEWRSTGLANYYISEDGYVYNTKTDHVLEGSPERNGYKVVNLYGKKHRIHVLVCTAFNGSRPAGYTVEHLDRCKDNNNYLNLKWETQKVNNNNRSNKGTKEVTLSYEQWRLLFDTYLTGLYSQYELTKWVNTQFNRDCANMVYNTIINGKSYKKWYSTLTKHELVAIKDVITKYKKYYR